MTLITEGDLEVKLLIYNHAVALFEHPRARWQVDELEDLINDLADIEESIENESRLSFTLTYIIGCEAKKISQKKLVKLLKLSLTRCLSHISLQQ